MSLAHAVGYKTASQCPFCRNGLGPVKEGEAQYAVVHCTGYIKAWPPAGKQGYKCVSREWMPFLCPVKTVFIEEEAEKYPFFLCS